MASSSFFGYSDKPRVTSALPSYSSAVHEKMHLHSRSMSWTVPVLVPIPGVRTRNLRLYVPNARRVSQFTTTRFGRRKAPILLLVIVLASLWGFFSFAKRLGNESDDWASTSGESSTLIFSREDLQRIWKWEIESGHYPSNAKIPEQIGLVSAPLNPALPPRRAPTIPSRFRPPPGPVVTTTRGDGPRRVYLDVQNSFEVAYPPRPVPGSVSDLDVIMENCDFSQNKYVRDCLEVLRIGGGLDNGNRLRRGKVDDWHYIYMDQERENFTEPQQMPSLVNVIAPRPASSIDEDPNAGLIRKKGLDWEPTLELRSAPAHIPYSSLPTPCDPEHPRLFHMFWTGPFTDKPYLALLSFLFTQNVGLHQKDALMDNVCRPEFWLWINPGPAAAVPNPSALSDMYESLKTNPWAAPFLHPRFKDVIKFKLWNTTDQLDGIPEIKDEWRELKETLFNSGGHVINVPAEKSQTVLESPETVEVANGTEADAPKPTAEKSDDDDMLNRTGSKSSSSYDRLSVILSDMARFVLCHRFGGIYLDADTIFLRDWEELWGWKGAFAYRWSRLEKYNTAVLRMNKNSALGSFLFRTALKNGLDFHPMTVSRYLKDSYIEGLLLRLPDALFDSAWLNTEYYQRDRPPQPYFQEFADFFDTPATISAQPQALGFEGFFRGAYSYHFHNFWWKPFDPSRNWPDLGPKFAAGERAARAAADPDTDPDDWVDRVADDKRDLDWATVLKRTFESYIRGERPNMYGEWLEW